MIALYITSTRTEENGEPSINCHHVVVFILIMLYLHKIIILIYITYIIIYIEYKGVRRNKEIASSTDHSFFELTQPLLRATSREAE